MMTVSTAMMSASSLSASSPKVLIIEDENQTRQLFFESLEAEGFHPIEAENGAVGLQLARKHLPDVIVCDVIMPELDGYGVLEALRQSPETSIIPFIFLTAKWEKVDFRRAMELGADDYLTKPCRLDHLTEAVTSQIKKRSILQQGYAMKFGQEPSETEPEEVEAAENLDPQEIDTGYPFEESLKKVFRFIEANYWRSITLAEVAEGGRGLFPGLPDQPGGVFDR